MTTLTETFTLTKHVSTIALSLFTTAMLSGCYVEVSHELEADNDTDSHSYAELGDYSTRFLVDAALVPIALSAESGGMVINPDDYTTPHARLSSRAVVIETTYAYLFDDWDCDGGGYTETEAEATTTRYDDGYTFVDIWLNAAAHSCGTLSQGIEHRINSSLSYDVTGWFDDWENRISSLDGKLNGWVNVAYQGRFVEHRSLSMQSFSVSGNDIGNLGSSRVELDDGFNALFADFKAERAVHLRLGETLPHAGSVEFRNARGWVVLSFEEDGVWRRDSQGRDRYIRWSTIY